MGTASETKEKGPATEPPGTQRPSPDQMRGASGG